MSIERAQWEDFVDSNLLSQAWFDFLRAAQSQFNVQFYVKSSWESDDNHPRVAMCHGKLFFLFASSTSFVGSLAFFSHEFITLFFAAIDDACTKLFHGTFLFVQKGEIRRKHFIL